MCPIYIVTKLTQYRRAINQVKQFIEAKIDKFISSKSENVRSERCMVLA